MGKHSLLKYIVGGAIVAGGTAYLIKKSKDISFEKTKETIEGLDKDTLKEEKEAPKRRYFNLGDVTKTLHSIDDNVRDFGGRCLKKVREEFFEEDDLHTPTREDHSDLKKEATNEHIFEPDEHIDIDEEPKEDDSKDTYESEFFRGSVKKAYKEFIEKFLNENNTDSMKYVARDIFDINGEFDIETLKTKFKDTYSYISKLLNDIEVLPNALGVDKYLEEIEHLAKEVDVETKVNGILSYWTSVNEAIFDKQKDNKED